MTAMGPALVIELPTAFDENRGLGAAAESFVVWQSAEVSGESVLPMTVAGPSAASRSQRMTLAVVNSASLSDRTNAGLPYSRVSHDIVKITSCDRRLAPTPIGGPAGAFLDGT